MSSELIESKELFHKWYKKFYEKHNGYQPDTNWFNRVQESHKGIRKFIGGIRLARKVEIDGSHEFLPSYNEAKGILFGIKSVIPDLEVKLGGDLSQLLRPTIRIGKRDIRTGRALLTWFDKSDNVERYRRGELEDYISKLGIVLSRNKCSGTSLNVNLTTAARAFCLLGHYTVDARSCFKQTGGNEDNKYYLAQSKDSFVLLLTDDEGRYVARFWGAAGDRYKTWNLTNFYSSEDSFYTQGDIFTCVKMFFANLLKIDISDLMCDSDKFGMTDDMIYQNEENWSYSKLKKEIPIQTLEVNLEGLDGDFFTCDLCHETSDAHHDEPYYLEGKHLCYECYHDDNKVHECDYSGQLTTEELVEVIGCNGVPWNVKKHYVDQKSRFQVCSNKNCEFKGMPIIVDFMKTRGGKKFCCPCALEIDYEKKSVKC